MRLTDFSTDSDLSGGKPEPSISVSECLDTSDVCDILDLADWADSGLSCSSTE